MLQKNNIPDIRRLLAAEPDRLSAMAIESSRWRFDASRTPIGLDAWQEGSQPANLEPARQAIRALFDGGEVNPSENQPALHMALRAVEPSRIAPADAAGIVRSRERMLELAEAFHAGESGLRTLLHVGIGGSDLGPRLVADSLDAGDGAVSVEWLTTLDAARARRLMNDLDPATTGLVIASKSFSTVETLKQASVLRGWLGSDGPRRTWAATANPGRAVEFGVPETNVLAFPGWTGGRFSLWSSVGLSAAATIGPDRWRRLLRGAERVDRDVCERLDRTAALALSRSLDALVRRFGYATLGVVSYAPGLRLLAEYLQQLIMESLGKSVSTDGSPLAGPTSPLVFGGAGTDLQHSLFQALHQGTTRHPMLLLGTTEAEPGLEDWQREQLAHLLGQASALVHGRDDERPEKSLPGNNPVMLMLARTLDADSVGELLATFEHAVYLLGVSWRINAFDQWGVEEGKRLAAGFRDALEGRGGSPDSSLDAVVDWIRGPIDEKDGL